VLRQVTLDRFGMGSLPTLINLSLQMSFFAQVENCSAPRLGRILKCGLVTGIGTAMMDCAPRLIQQQALKEGGGDALLWRLLRLCYSLMRYFTVYATEEIAEKSMG